MKRIGFITLGCKVNIYESNALKNELIQRGYEVTEAEEGCDAYIINTCSVTNMADAKSRKMIHKAKKFNPDAIICAMGCYVQTNPDAQNIEGVDILIGNGNKKEAIEQLERRFKEKNTEKYCNIIDILNQMEYEPLEVTTYDHTRAFVKIEDGCENFCTYCIIPYARGPVRCKKAQEVIAELKRICEQGYKEVVLAGIHTGRYRDNDINLSGLIQMIFDSVPKLERLRLSSIEINEIDEEFIELLRKYPILADHLHLPLQSGSDVVLQKMERKYDTAFFRNKIEKIREVRPNISITTDIIVGFPYETEEEFERTKEFIQTIRFSKLHIFPYSMRKNTKAVLMPQIPENIKKIRTAELIALSKQLEEEYAERFLNTVQEVIVEQEWNKEKWIGHTSNYLPVILDKNGIKSGEKVVVKLLKVKDLKVYGKINEKM